MSQRNNTATGSEKAFRKDLISWFNAHRRQMPWRSNRTPYRVWVAEIMLQQTRVDQVRPYYQRFMKSFPSLSRLASASLHDVLKVWEGMGYYARARNMHAAAKVIVSKHGGRFPRTFEGLLALPGIGSYTAAAIGSLAMDMNVAVVDGNVQRVISRVFAIDEMMGTARGKGIIQSHVDDLLPKGNAAAFNEALMELGALCCVPRNPHCGKCPLSDICLACARGESTEYPRRRKKKAIPHKVVGAGVIRNKSGCVLIAQRRVDDMLGGLWEFPGGTMEPGETMPECIVRELQEEMDITVQVGSLLTVVHHAYSHFTLELHAHWGRIKKGKPKAIECADFAWVPFGNLRDYPMGRADQQILEVMEEEGLLNSCAR